MNITKLFRTHPSLDYKASVFFLVIYDKCKKQGQYYTSIKIEDIIGGRKMKVIEGIGYG